MATIVIDPGHGGTSDLLGSSANQAVGRGGTLEKDLTLDVGTRVARALGDAGHRVSLTRDADVNLAAAERARIGRERGADVFLSLHFNAASDPSIQGTEVMVRADDPAGTPDEGSRRLAEAIRAQVPAALGIPDRGLRSGRWAILHPSLHDARTARCLVELSFLSDPAEETRLADVGYRDRTAAALARGVGDEIATPVAAPQAWFGRADGRFASGAHESYGRVVARELPRAPTRARTLRSREPEDRLEISRSMNHAQLDWCRIRHGIIRSAVEMQGAWLDANFDLMLEDNPAVLEHLQAFWRDGVEDAAWQQSAANSANNGIAWSGAFVSWVVRNGGVPNNMGFAFSGRHMDFIAAALRNRMRGDVHSPFWLFGINEQNLQQVMPGDIVCSNRINDGNLTTHTFANLRTRFWGENGENAGVATTGASHTEVAIGYQTVGAQRVLETIGGNTGHVTGPAEHTVGSHHRDVDANGVLTNPGRIFAFIKVMECIRVM